MRECNKRCIGNVNGFCAVEKCEGPICMTGKITDNPIDAAARSYNTAQKMLSDVFAK